MGIKEWWINNVSGKNGEGDFSRAPSTPVTTDKEPETFDLGLPEVPDVPSAPDPGQSLPDYAKGFVSDTAQGFFMSVITRVLTHIITRPDDKKKK